jgi:Cytidine and deoxycytidylate deaminase zinc-binding region
MHTDEDWMKLAIAEANEGLREAGGAEVRCVIVKDGRILQTSHNEVELRNDPTAHVEMVGIRELCAKFRISHLKGCTLYCTLQTVWNVLSSLYLGWHQPNRLWGDTCACQFGLLRDPARGYC